MNRHHVDAYTHPDRLFIWMQIQIRIRIRIRIQTQVKHKLEDVNFFPFIHSIASLHCFIFLISAKGVIIFSILDSILKFYWKKYSLSLHLVEMDKDLDPAP